MDVVNSIGIGIKLMERRGIQPYSSTNDSRKKQQQQQQTDRQTDRWQNIGNYDD